MMRRILIGVAIVAVILFVGHHPDRASADAKHGGNAFMSVVDGFGTFLDNLTK